MYSIHRKYDESKSFITQLTDFIFREKNSSKLIHFQLRIIGQFRNKIFNHLTLSNIRLLEFNHTTSRDVNTTNNCGNNSLLPIVPRSTPQVSCELKVRELTSVVTTHVVVSSPDTVPQSFHCILVWERAMTQREVNHSSHNYHPTPKFVELPSYKIDKELTR